MVGKQVDNINKMRGVPADDVLESLHALVHAYRARLARVLREDPRGLTPMDGKVLGFFGRQPGSTLSDLVAHSGRDKGQLARLVAGLRERGLIEAGADERDRRAVRLRLTGEGEALQRELQQQRRHLNRQALQGLDARERETLRQLIAKLHASLDTTP